MAENIISADYSRVLTRDHEGLLAVLSSSGAWYRSIANDLKENKFEKLKKLGTPRSVILIAKGQTAKIAADFLNDFYNQKLGTPIIVTDNVPKWCGVLDVVILFTDFFDDQESMQIASLLTTRLSVNFVSAINGTPTWNVGAQSKNIIAANGIYSPFTQVNEFFSLHRHLSLGLAVLETLLGQEKLETKFDLIADNLDQTISALIPINNPETNPVINLIENIQDYQIVWTYPDQISSNLAQLAVTRFYLLPGIITQICSVNDLLYAGKIDRIYRNSNQIEDNIFYDPEFDDPVLSPTKVIVLSLTDSPQQIHQVELIEERFNTIKLPDQKENDILISFLIYCMYIELAATVLLLK